jgi:hypothetical protein
MNGEVQLIVRVAGTAPSGIVTATESGVINDSVNPQQVFSYPNDMSAYVGGYVQIQSLTYGDLGTYYITGVDINNPALSYVSPNNTQIFTTFPWNFNVGGADLPNFNYMAAVPSVTEKYLDLFENESISQTWRFTDLNNFQSLGAFSREFRVPFSDRNQEALGALFDVNVDAGTANFFHYKLPAEIRVDTLPIASGYLRVRKVYRQQGKINEVELAFYAETPDLVKKIGEKKLQDITDLPNLNEVVQYSNVTNPSAERIWTILDRGQLWSEGGEANTRSLLTDTAPVFASDLTPALNWWYLFSNIISDAGFELEAGTLENIMTNYWMPWCVQRNLIGTDSFNNEFFRAYNSATQVIAVNATTIPINTEVFDNGGDFNPGTFTYVTPTNGYYTFHFVNKFTVSGQVDSVSYFLDIDGDLIFLEDFNVFNNAIIDFTFRIGIDAGSNVQLKIKKNNAAPANVVTLVAGDGTFNTSIFELIKTEFNYDQGIYYNLNAPDVKQMDFVNDVLKMHNCAIIPDRTNPLKLSIVPQNDYLGSGNTLDWTRKMDISKDMVMYSTVELQKSTFQFTYTAGEDVLSKQYKNVNRVYGDYEAVGYTINPDTSPSDFLTGNQKIQLTTQSTPAGVVRGSGYVMPMFINDALEFVTPGSRCLFEAGTVNVQLFNDGTLASALTAVPVLNNYSQVLADIDDEDLNWAPEVPPHSIITNPYNNLFNKFWRSYMNALYSPEARIMEASFALDLKDILTFSFADKIWIQDSYWRILEINDYKVGNYESTSVKLIKFLEDTEDCTGTPSTISVNGQVNFVDANGDAVTPTQDCCSRYGYNWDEGEAICWAFTPTGDRPVSGTNGGKTNPSPRVTKVAVQTRAVVNSVINGQDMAIDINNSNMLAVGRDLTLTKNVNGSNLLGKNVYTNLPGLHLGGGYRDGNIIIEQGWAQSGTVILHRKDSYPSAGNAFYYVEGVTNEHIELSNDTLWSCLLNVTVWDTNAGTYATGQYSFALTKVGGVAAVSAITALNTVNTTAFTFTIGVNVAVATQHRLFLTVGGGGTYPVNIITTASLQYQQSKIS